MAFNLSVKTKALSQNTKISPQIILEIEGVDLIFGAAPVLEVTRWDGENLEWDSGIFWDSETPKAESRDYIELGGTTKNMSQQIKIDKGGSSSITTATIEILDKNSEVAKKFSFDSIGEILGRRCGFYTGFAGGAFPEDMIPILFGYINDIAFENGSVLISIASTEALKRQNLFNTVTTQLTAAIDSGTDTIPMSSTTGFLPSQDALTSYIRIDDEIMEVVSIDSDTQMTVIRGELSTVQNAHDDESDVVSQYSLEGSPLDVARKLMLSDDGNTFYELDIEVKSANFDVGNALLFESYNIETITGLELGDTIRIPSGVNAGDFTITGFGTRNEGDSYITVLGLVEDSIGGYTISYRSQWNVLTTGLGMQPNEVDLPQFDTIEREFGNSFVPIFKFFSETLENAKQFIDEELFFNQSMYSIIRGAKSSVNYTAPPLSSEVLPTLDATNVINPEKIKQKRSSYKYLYNEILYEYNEDVVNDKFLNVYAVINEDSKNRIKVGNKQLKISAGSLRRSNLTLQALELASNRLITRYKFAAQYYSGVQVLYKDYFNIEVGDTVILDGASLKFVDPQTGERNLPLQQYEIVNKSIGLTDGTIKLDIANTGFLLSQRFGVFSPSSEIVSGSTATNLKLRETLATGEFEFEPQRYADFRFGQIRVRSYDYTFDEITTIEAISTTDPNVIIVSALSQVPQDGWIFELPNYDDLNDSEESELYKLKYTFEMYRFEIDTVVDESNFDVLDATNMYIGQTIQVHSDDFSRDSNDVVIANIVGNSIELEEALEFLPVTGDKVEARSFPDGDGYSLR